MRIVNIATQKIEEVPDSWLMDNLELIEDGIYKVLPKIEKNEKILGNTEDYDLTEIYYNLSKGDKDLVASSHKKIIKKSGMWILVDRTDKSEINISVSQAKISDAKKLTTLDKKTMQSQIDKYLKGYMKEYFLEYSEEIKKLNENITDSDIMDRIEGFFL